MFRVMDFCGNIFIVLLLASSGPDLTKAEYCSSSFDCTGYYDAYCCTNSNECCSLSEYNDDFNDDFNNAYETGYQLATGVVIAIVVVTVLAIIGCVVGCVFCCRRSNMQQGRVLGPVGVVTTTTHHAGQPGVPVQQAGYQPVQQKVTYPHGPAPTYMQPGQQPGMPPPYTAQAAYPSQNTPGGYQPMPALPPGNQTPYPPQAVSQHAPYPAQPAYAPDAQPQYPTQDVPLASAPPAI